MADTAWLNRLDAQICEEEGLRLKPYKDTNGNLSIGYGRNLTGKGLSKTEATVLYLNDRNDAVTDAAKLPYWPKLDPVRRLAIADLVFNLGLRTFLTFETFHRLMEQGQYARAGQDLTSTLWAHEVSTTRAGRIVTQIIQGAA